MPSADLLKLTISELAPKVQSSQASAVEVTEAVSSARSRRPWAA